jgi:hypothetical protein
MLQRVFQLEAQERMRQGFSASRSARTWTISCRPRPARSRTCKTVGSEEESALKAIGPPWEKVRHETTLIAASIGGGNTEHS